MHRHIFGTVTDRYFFMQCLMWQTNDPFHVAWIVADWYNLTICSV